MQELEQFEAQSRGESTTLAILVHPYTGSPDVLKHVRGAVAEALPDCDLLIPAFRAGLFANTNLITVAEKLVAAIDRATEQVVFVVHGIRDMGHWTRQVGKRVEAVAGDASEKRVRAIFPSYGFFSMAGFLLWLKRRKNVRWFMDEYTQVVARYPNARIGFIGHSNGTFLVGDALNRYATTKFDRVALAGSVLPRQFKWDQFVGQGRVTAVRNDVASADFVIGVFPRLFELLGRLFHRPSEIGGAGLLGFTTQGGQQNAVTYIKGGHSAALREPNHESLARFVVDGIQTVPGQLVINRQSRFAIIGSRLCLLIWLILLLVVVTLGIGFGMLWSSLGWLWFPWLIGRPLSRQR